MTPRLRTCSMCEKTKPETEFWIGDKGHRLRRCAECCRETATWKYADYSRVHQIQPEEEYIISKLAEQPTLAAGLDELYRRDPRRWHQLCKAAMLKRKETYANSAA